ncbi:MAG: hypothetical protein KDM91_09980, partial [Verrucomicrobiae bacterium]|nr:hypothetical protein [Verrucomicrobiae bacterium]
MTQPCWVGSRPAGIGSEPRFFHAPLCLLPRNPALLSPPSRRFPPGVPFPALGPLISANSDFVKTRTHHCNELRPAHAGESVTLTGWVNTKRDHHGVIFIDIRDREGVTQCVFRPEESAEAAALSHSLRHEDVIQVTGRVEPRPEFEGQSTVNPNIDTGEIEVVAGELAVLNKAEVLPFQLDKELSNEDLRMKHRYLDLRRPRLARNLRLRHAIGKAVRDGLDEAGFLEIETPILSKSTPEGARDFLVPSRLSPGKFYALPQAPQQYKQMLMVAGIEKYFQIARCFRDE